jgi:hypothetical protein
MNLSDGTFSPVLEKTFRLAIGLVGLVWICVGSLGSLMSVLGGELIVSGVFALLAILGVGLWRVASRRLDESIAALGRFRARLESRVNGSTPDVGLRKDKQ